MITTLTTLTTFKRGFLALLFLFLGSIHLFSQLDTEHFLPPITSSTHKFIGGAGAGYQVIYLSTPSKTPVNYTIYSGNGTVLYTGTVSNGAPKNHGGEGGGAMIGLNTPLMVNQANLNKKINGKGIRVVADAPVYCNLRIRSPNNAQAASITAKGKTALGTTFRLGHIPTPQKASNWGLQSLGSKLATVGFYASEDNTTITVDLTTVKPVLWGPNAPNTNGTFTITLNKGQTYVMALRNQDAPNRNAGAGFSGGLVTSTKPIAVTTASMGGYTTNTWQADYGADQIVPIEEVGTKYAVVRGASNDNNLEQVMVVAHENGTEIKVNGVVVKTLNAGQIYKVHGSKYVQGSMFIETSKPAYVYQMMMGSNGGDKKTPGMNFVPPISCKTSNYVDNIPLVNKIGNTNYKGTISIVTTKTGSNLELFINGVKSNNKLGTPKNVPNSDYRFYKISNLTGNIAVYSKTIALVSFTGYNGAAGFGGYFSGWEEEVVHDSVTCLPGYVFELSGKFDAYRWFKDGVEIPGETGDSLFATETGYYQYEYTKGACKDTSDSIWAVGLNKFQLEGDTFFCPTDSVEWEIVGSGFDSISWATGSQAQSLFIDAPGKTNVRIYSDVTKECFVDTHVTTIHHPVPTVSLPDTTFCTGDSVLYDAQNIGNFYVWNNLDTNQTLYVKQSGIVGVKVTNPEGCSAVTTANATKISCNTDAEVTKSDFTDKYYAGASTIYSIVTKNHGPADVTAGTVSDPLPNGIGTGDVTWTAIAYGGATTTVTGIQTGALSDVVDIPAGDSVVYTVNITVPLNFSGDLENTVTITADNDTFPDNNVATDIDTKDCNFQTAGTIDSRNAGWVKFGNVITGVPYQVASNGGTKTFVANNGPAKGDTVTTIIYNTQTGNSVSLERDRYKNNNSYFNTIGIYDNTPHGWTGLSGVGAEGAPILGFMAFVDQNGNGIFDSGLEQYFRDITSLSFTPTATGELYMAFYDDGVYTDNAGIINISVQSQLESTDLGQDTAICLGQSVTLDAQNPTAASWEWNTGATTQTINVSASGEYSVEITSAGGCQVFDTINVAVHGIDVSLPNDTAFCDGPTLTINALSDSAISYNWNTGENGPSITIDTTGNYKVTVANSLGCADSDSIQITVNPLPDVVLRNDTAFCQGGSVTLDAGAFDAYSWNVGNENGQSITVDSTFEYKVVVSTVEGCLDSDSVQVTVHPLLDAELPNDTAFCIGESITIDAGSANSWTWNTGATTQAITVDVTGLYKVVADNIYGCKDSDSVNVTVNLQPLVTLDDDTICPGFSTSFTANSATATSYLWGKDGSGTMQTIGVDGEGDYEVVVTDANGCKDTAEAKLVFHTPPTVTVTPDTICVGDAAGTLTANSATAITYLWTDNGSGSNSISNGLTPGDYTVEVSDNNGCKDTATGVLKVDTLPMVSVNNAAICSDVPSVDLTATSTTAVAYSWSGAGTATTKTIAAVDAGTYTVTVTDENGCTQQSSGSVSKVQKPADFKILGDSIACEGDEIDFFAAVAAQTITWDDGTDGPDLTVDQNGIYSVTAINEANGVTCSTTVSKETTFLPYADQPAEKTFKNCFDYIHEITIDIETPAKVLWDGGTRADSTLVVTDIGIYDATVYLHEMCPIDASVEVEEYCPANLFLPNAFTPNDDGRNDNFATKGYNLTGFEIWIFNRWGEQIFTTQDVNNWWDGKVNGNKVQIDVYVYKARYTFLNEEEREQVETLVGTVTVIR